MEIKLYKQEYLDRILKLFYDTVHEVNIADYTKEQADAWAPLFPDKKKWQKSIQAHYALTAWEGEILTGFGDIDSLGYLDRLYVHKDFQGRGIASALLMELEDYGRKQGAERFFTYSSITARPFFKKQGYILLWENVVERKGILLKNYRMEKPVREGKHG